MSSALRRGQRRWRAALAGIAAGALALLSAPAWADNIHDDVAASGPTTITLSGGSATTTIKYYVQDSGGCDISSTPSVYKVNIAGAAGVTANPANVSFAACGTRYPVVFTATSAGARAVTLTWVSGPDLGSNAANPADFTLTVNAPTNTAPQVSVGGVGNGATYEIGSVPAASCTVTDAQDLNPTATPSLSAISGPLAGYGLGSQTATCSYTDGGGLTASASATYTIVDTQKPTLNTPGDRTAEATGPAGAVVTWTGPTASDNVALSGSPTCDANSGDTFPLGVTTVNCQVRDVAGNQATGSFKVTVTDQTGPSLTISDDVTEEATGPSGAAVTYNAPIASDLHDGTVPAVCTPASGGTFPVGNTTVSCSATDNSGNESTGSFTVQVTDHTPPTVTVPDDMTLEATSPDGAAATFEASAADLVDGTTPVTCDAGSGDTFGFGTTTVSCSSTDAHENTGHASFTVTVRDTTPPALATHGDETAEATGPTGAVVSYTKPAASDVASTTVQVDCIPESGTTFGLGSTTVNCTATDEHENQSTTHFDVVVQDTTAPDVTVPSNITAEATSGAGATVTYDGASATDLVDGAITPTCDPASGSTFPLGDTTVTCSATDAHHNTGSNSFTVTVQDTTGPELTLPSSITKTATSAAGATVSYEASATDLVDGAVTPVCAPASGSLFSLGKTTVSCTATDSHENGSTGTFVVSVIAPWNGILQPINSNGSSVFKLGSTVPVKFASFPGLTATLKVTQADSTPDGTYVEPVNSNPADSGWVFRYDSTAGQYIYNLGTKNLSAGDWYLHIDLGDGVDHVVKFSLKK